ncbi:hypothetical protein [Brachybacterium kimchii]|uniref:Uncharacterized protein n=1 Tax=Brachybacterium kimchii TaxID=2942909 RepID=A0ABY4N7F2_9MICO|nr:hypothetical protein [Brachybacterium kimchii]UQN30477.1 hypothetical protein M4486_03805 [Brachybacterium kimchii]
MNKSKVDLSGSWSQIWGRVQDSISGVDLMLIAIAIGIALFAIIKFIVKNRRSNGGAGGGKELAIELLIAGIFAAPSAFLPLFLLIADALLNLGLALLGLANG